jgi:TRAP-type C4-dicarboxylate transport system permease small subunit
VISMTGLKNETIAHGEAATISGEGQYEHLPRLLRGLARGIEFLIASLGSFLIALVFMNAALRFIINSDISWSLEIVTFLMLWVTFLGCAAAAARRAHMRVTEIAAFVFSVRSQRRLELGINAVVIGILLSAIWYGAEITIHNWQQETTVLYWPVGLLYAAMPFGLLLSLVFVSHDFYASYVRLGSARNGCAL